MRHAKAPKLIRIFFGSNGRVFWHSEARNGKVIDRCAQGNGYSDARYVRSFIRDRYSNVKVVDETMPIPSAKANATKAKSVR